MKTIIISPYSRKLRNGQKDNPKNYPFWRDVVKQLKEEGYNILQVGVEGENRIEGVDEVKYNLPLKELAEEIKKCHTWISVDNFFQHISNYLQKKGIVLFGQSDPNIFGHIGNINLLKDRKYLRGKQFDIWEATQYKKEVFVAPIQVLKAIKQIGG